MANNLNLPTEIITNPFRPKENTDLTKIEDAIKDYFNVKFLDPDFVKDLRNKINEKYSQSNPFRADLLNRQLNNTLQFLGILKSDIAKKTQTALSNLKDDIGTPPNSMA